jgi:hypothetical protein
MEFFWTNDELSDMTTFVNIELEIQRKESVVGRVLMPIHEESLEDESRFVRTGCAIICRI